MISCSYPSKNFKRDLTRCIYENDGCLNKNVGSQIIGVTKKALDNERV